MERSVFKNFKFFIILTLGFHFLVSSCRSPKEIIYFQDLSTEVKDSIQLYSVHKIQPNDILEIGVNSLNLNSDEQFARGFLSYSENTNRVPGYMVDNNGKITIPYAGEIFVQGLTSIEAKQLIAQKLENYLKDPVVNLRIANFRISIIGEVARPGTYIVKEEKVSLPEALSLAGDLTIFAKRQDMLLIREENGVRNYRRIDLTKSEILSSTDYYLKSNDILYIVPSKAKISQNDTRTWQLLSFFATIAALTSVIISNLSN